MLDVINDLEGHYRPYLLNNVLSKYYNHMFMKVI